MPNGVAEADQAGAVREEATVEAGMAVGILAVAGMVAVMRGLEVGMAVDAVTPTLGEDMAGATMAAVGTAEGEGTTVAIMVPGTMADGGLALRLARA